MIKIIIALIIVFICGFIWGFGVRDILLDSRRKPDTKRIEDL